jgi:hypothetical protein
MGEVWISVLSIETVCVWELTLVDVNVRDVPGFGGVVELPQPVRPTASRAKKAAQKITAITLLGNIRFSPLLVE